MCALVLCASCGPARRAGKITNFPEQQREIKIMKIKININKQTKLKVFHFSLALSACWLTSALLTAT